MSINKVDYDVLNDGKRVYNEQSEALQAIIDALASMNSQLEAGWENETARAFIDKYETDFKPVLLETRDALYDISQFIQQYVATIQDTDAKGASALGR